MKTKKLHIYGLTLIILLAALLGACGQQTNEATETLDSDALITQIVMTARAGSTQTAQAMPVTPTFTPTIPATNTLEPIANPTTGITTPTATIAYQQPSTGSSGGTTSTCDVASFVSDVTVSDGTQFAPGEKFTKTWELKNTGTCTWNAAYQIVYYGGEQMEAGPTDALTGGEIAPGDVVQVSLDMTAPDTVGEYYSYWILRNANGENFLIDGSSIYVQINVAAGSTSTPTATTGAATATTNSATAVPSNTPITPTVPTNTPMPTVSISANPASGDTSTSITFTPSVVDGGGNALTIDSVEWTYDGQTSPTNVLTYTFPNPGQYTVTANVTYNGGQTGTAQITVTIS